MVNGEEKVKTAAKSVLLTIAKEGGDEIADNAHFDFAHAYTCI